ncbi:MAG: sugar transferase [Pyrinomonadaceae bacterium]
MYRTFFKRVLDLTFSAVALILLSPLILIVSLAIYLEDRGSIIFRQRRVGAGGSTFEVLKFRSMPESTGDVESARAHGLPVTRVGRFIRRTNIDELPQLVNVLRGDMSIVGPRPSVASQVGLSRLREANGSIRCLPGVTGLAQIHGYDGMPDDEKAQWDGDYSKTMSFSNDVKIILRTFGYLRKRPPVY